MTIPQLIGVDLRPFDAKKSHQVDFIAQLGDFVDGCNRGVPGDLEQWKTGMLGTCFGTCFQCFVWVTVQDDTSGMYLSLVYISWIAAMFVFVHTYMQYMSQSQVYRVCTPCLCLRLENRASKTLFFAHAWHTNTRTIDTRPPLILYISAPFSSILLEVLRNEWTAESVFANKFVPSNLLTKPRKNKDLMLWVRCW